MGEVSGVNSRFTALMDERRRSGAWLSRESGVSGGVVSKLLRTDRKPRWDTVCRIAKTLNVEPEALWDPRLCEGSPSYVGRKVPSLESGNKEGI